MGVRSTLSVSGLAPVGMICAGGILFLCSISTLISIEYFSKLKIRYTKLINWNNLITLFFEKFLKQSVVDKKIDEKEAFEIKKFYSHYLDKRKEIMKNTQFKVEDVFCEVKSKDNFSQKQIPNLIIF